MANISFNTKRLTYIPPDKGSFPLDHDGVCKDLMIKYISCLRENEKETTLCRQQIKAYLDCRMNNDLMAKEPWSKLGFSENEEVKSTNDKS